MLILTLQLPLSKNSHGVENGIESFHLCPLCSAAGGGLTASVGSSLVFSVVVGFPVLLCAQGTMVPEPVLPGNLELTCMRLQSHCLGGFRGVDNMHLLGG